VAGSDRIMSGIASAIMASAHNNHRVIAYHSGRATLQSLAQACGAVGEWSLTRVDRWHATRGGWVAQVHRRGYQDSERIPQ
jgi:hypothetical protein